VLLNDLGINVFCQLTTQWYQLKHLFQRHLLLPSGGNIVTEMNDSMEMNDKVTKKTPPCLD
jgi:hypothetical protein